MKDMVSTSSTVYHWGSQNLIGVAETVSICNYPIDYKVGDVVESKSEDTKGICTGFCHGNTCVMIDGKCYGGKSYFRKATKPE